MHNVDVLLRHWSFCVGPALKLSICYNSRQFEKVRMEKDALLKLRKEARDKIERLAANHELEPFRSIY